MEKEKDMGYIIIQQVIYMKVNIKMVIEMDKVHIYMRMEINMKAGGKKEKKQKTMNPQKISVNYQSNYLQKMNKYLT